MSESGQPPPVSGCQREILGRGLFTQVEICATCGVLHFTIGSLTLRLEPLACRDIEETLVASMGELDRRAAQAGRQPHAHLRLVAGGLGPEVSRAGE